MFFFPLTVRVTPFNFGPISPSLPYAGDLHMKRLVVDFFGCYWNSRKQWSADRLCWCFVCWLFMDVYLSEDIKSKPLHAYRVMHTLLDACVSCFFICCFKFNVCLLNTNLDTFLALPVMTRCTFLLKWDVWALVVKLGSNAENTFHCTSCICGQ